MKIWNTDAKTNEVDWRTVQKGSVLIPVPVAVIAKSGNI